jgi:hypothetical protein
MYRRGGRSEDALRLYEQALAQLEAVTETESETESESNPEAESLVLGGEMGSDHGSVPCHEGTHTHQLKLKLHSNAALCHITLRNYQVCSHTD